MKERCLEDIENAIGRDMGDAEGDRLERQLNGIMGRLARQDPEAWRARPLEARMREAAKVAAEDYIARAQKEQQRIEQKIAAHDFVDNYLSKFPKAMDRLHALSNLVAVNAKGGGVQSVESMAKAIENEALSHMVGTLEAANPKFFGLIENPEGTRDLVREMYGTDSGKAEAKAGAKLWHETAAELRQRFNDAGGKVGRLSDWAHPQLHSQKRVAVAGFDAWKRDVMPLLNRAKYVTPEGDRYSDVAIDGMLQDTYRTIITDGAAGIIPGEERKVGVAANRNAEHRYLFLNGPDAWMKYNGLYGDKTIWDVMTGHVKSLARDAALVERLGPDPDQLWNYYIDKSHKEAALEGSARLDKVQGSIRYLNDLYNFVANPDANVVNQKVANAFQSVRNLQTAAKLGHVVITAFSDEASVAATAYANKVSPLAVWRRELANLNPNQRRASESAGLGLQTFSTGLNRYGQDELGSSWSSKLANWTMHASGAEKMWDLRRQGLGTVLMSSIGKLSRSVEHITDLNPTDHGMLATKGVTDATWQVWRRSETSDWGAGGHTMLTPALIHEIPDSKLRDLGDPTKLRRDAATALLGHVLEEAGMGVMDVGARQRMMLGANLPKGSFLGEMARSIALFKSYPVAMITKHWARANSLPTATSRNTYRAIIIGGTTLIGAAVIEANDLLTGKNPDNVLSPRFWMRAILKGGGLGLYGDFLYDEFTTHGAGALSSLLGPVYSTADEAAHVGAEGVKELAGERGNFGGDLIKLMRSNVPGNFWYAKAAMDHLIFNQLQEWASPGYLGRMQDKAAQRGQSYWWAPDENVPSQAPDMTTAIQ